MKISRISTLILQAACLAMLLPCCSPKEKEDNSPKVLKISPASKSESGLAHDVVFSVVCDADFSVDLADGSWASVSSKAQGSGDAVDVTVSLKANTGSDAREETVTVSAGSLTASAKITQKGLGNLTGVDNVELVNTVPVVLSWKMPSIWTAKCYDESGAEASWFTIEPASGLNGTPTEVSISANSINIGSSARKGSIVISLDGGTELSVGVSQDVLKLDYTDYGFYNYDGANSSIAYDALLHQVSTVSGSSGLFRMVSPSEKKFLLLEGLPSSFSSGDAVNISLYQNWTSALDYSSLYSTTVYKTDRSMVWLVTNDGACFVIDNPAAL